MIRRIINWYNNRRKVKCRGCEALYERAPSAEEMRFDCPNNCGWMLWEDGTQGHDYPGE